MPDLSNPFADNPSRWLVVCNSNAPDSLAWAQHYAQLHHLPPANVLALDLPLDERISLPAFTQLSNAIDLHLAAHNLTSHILGILLGPAVPGYLDDGQLRPLASLLHQPGGMMLPLHNPLHAITSRRPDRAALAGLRFTARIDGPTPAAALALVDRAHDLRSRPALPFDTSVIHLDPWTIPGPIITPIANAIAQWGASLDRMRTRLNVRLITNTDPGHALALDAAHHDGFLWGWSLPTPPPGFFAEPAGSRAFCLQAHPTHPTAVSLRTPTPTHWIETALAHGYAAAAGTARPISPTSMPDIATFFHALALGWTLAEAWTLACPLLGDALFLIGDPLMTLPFPRAGWDLFGPLDSLDQLNPHAPALALPEHVRSLTLPPDLLPPDNSAAFYILRHLDAHGRSEAGLTCLRLTSRLGLPAAPPPPPLWPDAEHWTPPIEAARLRPFALWDHPPADDGIARIELQARSDSGDITTLSLATPTPLDPRVAFDLPLPATPTCLRFRVLNREGVATCTPWSAPVEAPVVSPIPLTCVEN